MRIAFITNFYNHHQKPLADAMYAALGDDYYFIETAPIPEERLNMGWGGEEKPSYVMQYYTDGASRDRCVEIIENADVVILGAAVETIIKSRLEKGLLTFMYTERKYKEGVPYHKLPVHCWRAMRSYVKYKNFYMLCASAYTAADYARQLAFIGKTYKWGYFPIVKKYDSIDSVISSKKKNSILWVSRFIPLKHPEHAVAVAERLLADGYDFKLNMIGTGELVDSTRELIESKGLSSCVELLGTMKPEQVREYMEQSEVFLFTSDRNEGWGAVLNESMNSACAVVASSAIGSVPFLIQNGENGYIYKDGDVEGLYKRVKQLLDDSENRKKVAEKAYITMTDEWNADISAERFISLCEKMLSGEYKPFPYESGPCSKAKILKDNWMK